MALAWRLRKHADYQRAYAGSRKGSTRQIGYFFSARGPAVVGARSPVAGSRVGLTVPKAVGKAHERNRIKRRMRAIVRTEVGRLGGDVDVILHPRRGVLEAEFGAVRREVVEIFGRVVRAMAAGAGDGAEEPRAGRGRAGRR